MRTIFIDAVNRKVEEWDYNGEYQEISRKIGCDLFTCVGLTEDTAVFVDDEGLINGKWSEFFIMFPHPSPLAGHGLIISRNDEGESVGCDWDLDEIRKRLTFLDALDLRQIYAG